MKLSWHALFWGATFYFFAIEGKLSAGALLWMLLAVLLPWFWLRSSGLFMRSGHEAWLSINPFLWLRFLVLFIKEFLLANWQLVKLIWSTSKEPNDIWIEVNSYCPSPMGQVMIANFISLTPGTISWNISSQKNVAIISVHVVDESTKDEVQKLVDRLDPLVTELSSPFPFSQVKKV